MDNIKPACKLMDGKIIKTHRGIYYVDADRVIPCKARGLFRDRGLKPTVGDNVRLRISEEDGSGYIEEIYPRKNQLLRPYVSNVDHVMIVMSVRSPDINPYLLDRFLLMCAKSSVEAIIVLNKSDLLTEEDAAWIHSIYEPIGYPLFLTSVLEGTGIVEVRNLIRGKTTVFAGPSGVGKSSLLHAITDGKWQPETGEISGRTRRGKHTTRHAELFISKRRLSLSIRPDSVRWILIFLKMSERSKNSCRIFFNMRIAGLAIAITSRNRDAA